jgi:hypothetical protein
MTTLVAIRRQLSPQMRDSFALGALIFFERSSRSAAPSSICSARSFFSFAFSSSSSFDEFLFFRHRRCPH